MLDLLFTLFPISSASSKRDAFLAAVKGVDNDNEHEDKTEMKEKKKKEITTSKNVVANAKKSVAKAQLTKVVKKEQKKEELYEADSEIDLSIEDPIDQVLIERFLGIKS